MKEHAIKGTRANAKMLIRGRKIEKPLKGSITDNEQTREQQAKTEHRQKDRMVGGSE